MTSPKLFVYKMLMVFHCNFTYLCRCVCVIYQFDTAKSSNILRGNN